MVQKGIRYEKDGYTYTVLDIGDEHTEDGPNVVLRKQGQTWHEQIVVKSLREVVRDIAGTLSE
jgi:hypothetical protein